MRCDRVGSPSGAPRPNRRRSTPLARCMAKVRSQAVRAPIAAAQGVEHMNLARSVEWQNHSRNIHVQDVMPISVTAIGNAGNGASGQTPMVGKQECSRGALGGSRKACIRASPNIQRRRSGLQSILGLRLRAAILDGGRSVRARFSRGDSACAWHWPYALR
jgi:hypothetical protein